ncbi:glycosyltransferase [Flavobacterium sp.]|uniref:glycosyltransferase n=1 Tax=Flavobacterium sp. TaxID=239 RepID=UPI0026234D7F|nr:glycosyltransferase [Flavobacterium sp.]MDD3003999.1 glycosyltransferase [Flavobacterium sp.]
MKRKKLLIISHTEHYTDEKGIVKGWGATVNEINYLADFWEEVVHIGCLYPTTVPPSALPYIQSNIRFVPIPPYGGKTIMDKLLILVKIPKIMMQVMRNVGGASEVQLRLPTSMGLFLLPLFSFIIPRTFTLWVKYAGNWNQKNPPLSYRFQRGWLKKNTARCKVTLNGFWNDQPEHCLSFENPCLTQEDLSKGKVIATTKTFQAPYVFAFVGRLDEAKGVSTIIQALKKIPITKIGKVHFIGNGPELQHYQSETEFLKEKVIFYGFQNSENVHALLAESHFFVLPSKAEGFPKVVAEAACYGVIPIVSDVGSIPHYINQTNGFVWKREGEITFSQIVNNAVTTAPEKLWELSQQVQTMATLFTFENYKKKLEQLVLDKKK